MMMIYYQDHVKPAAMLLSLALTTIMGSVIAAANRFVDEENIKVKFMVLLIIHTLTPFIWIWKNEEMVEAFKNILKNLK